MVLASTSLLLALSWGGVRYPWGSAVVVSLLAAAVLLGAGFAARLATAAEPLIPTNVLRTRWSTAPRWRPASPWAPSSASPSTCRSSSKACSASRPASPGVALVPLMIGTVTGATLSGRSMLYFKRYKRVPMVMMGVSVACCAAIAV